MKNNGLQTFLFVQKENVNKASSTSVGNGVTKGIENP